ncbi:YisL family protein [Bacillus massiliigorillae]|uniref:YisL family protein n=1 Tax=Bacillus massiliigorillae TaxID=1243664 RepID=UPI0003A0C1A3|nr:YisL family protein [Bacillus massiliigorillae]
MTHMHITTWVAALVLLIVATSLLKKGNQQGYKTTHMILRVVYLLIIATGGMLLIGINITPEYVGKIILGIVVIGLMEMLLVRMSKGKGAMGFGIILVVALVAIIALGFRLPQGFHFLA